jgi:hypothetical protein
MRGKPKARKHRPAAVRPQRTEQIEKNVRTLIEFPGMDLAKLYRGVVQESRSLGDPVASPAYPLSAEMLDRATAMLLQEQIDSGKPDSKMIARLQRGVHGAESYRVARYVAESTLGASAMAVDGVNRLLRLRGELKAEKTSGRTIDNMPEEPQ